MIARENFSNRGKIRPLEARYIKKVLSEEGQNILDEQKKRITQYNAIKSGELLRNRFSRGKADQSLSGELNMTFLNYMRFNDMKRRKLKASLEEPAKRGRKIYRKHIPLYNSVVFGHLNNIVNRISYGFTQEVIREMKELEGHE